MEGDDHHLGDTGTQSQPGLLGRKTWKCIEARSGLFLSSCEKWIKVVNYNDLFCIRLELYQIIDTDNFSFKDKKSCGLPSYFESVEVQIPTQVSRIIKSS